jgi:hypothetical protein
MEENIKILDDGGIIYKKDALSPDVIKCIELGAMRDRRHYVQLQQIMKQLNDFIEQEYKYSGWLELNKESKKENNV